MLIKRILRLKWKQVFSLLGLIFKQPQYALPTLRATSVCMSICNREYGSIEHHLNNASNAVRHALWNLLIIRKSLLWNRNENKALKWAKTMTEWHEKFSVNDPLDQEMDLHNNKIGRNLFLETRELSEKEIVTILQEKAKDARKIFKLKESEKYPINLVYISD